MGYHKQYELPRESYDILVLDIKRISGMNKYHELCGYFCGQKKTSISDFTYYSAKVLKRTGTLKVEGNPFDTGKVTIDVWAAYQEPLDEICNELERKLNMILVIPILDDPLGAIKALFTKAKLKTTWKRL